jgi:hypothetical protein
MLAFCHSAEGSRFSYSGFLLRCSRSFDCCDLAFWLLHPEITYLNHRSFGGRPRTVLEIEQEVRAKNAMIDGRTDR